MSASQLDDLTLQAFAANLPVVVLQMVGRGMRGHMPVEVYFVDAAWAPRGAEGLPDTPRSSVLVTMRHILGACVAAPDPDQRAIYQALYGIFAAAFQDINGVLFPDGQTAEADEEDWRPSTAELEDALDGWDPDTDTWEEVDDAVDGGWGVGASGEESANDETQDLDEEDAP
jgi:hypothetical protein